jgi:hypothetical protein
MLAEKFFLVLETLISNDSSDIITISAAPHIAVKSCRTHTRTSFSEIEASSGARRASANLTRNACK